MKHILRAKPINWKTNPNNNNYVYGFYHVVTNNYDPHNTHQITKFHENENGEIILTEIIDIDPSTISTCTNTTDANNNYIWENDKIKTNTGYTGTVIFKNGEYLVQLDEKQTIIPIRQINKGVEIITDETNNTNYKETNDIINDLITMLNETDTDTDKTLKLCERRIKKHYGIENNNTYSNTKPDFSNMPCKINDIVYCKYMENDIRNHIFYHITQHIVGQVHHFYIDETGTKQIAIQNERNNNIIICTVEEFKKTFTIDPNEIIKL